MRIPIKLGTRIVVVLIALPTQSVTMAQEPPASAAEQIPGLELLLSLQTTENPRDDALRKLLKARCNEAAAEMRVSYALFMDGRLEFEPVFDSASRVVQAWLELDEGPSKRISMLTADLELSKFMLTAEQSRLEQGVASAIEFHLARCRQLDAEVRLLQAKKRVANTGQDGQMRRLLRARLDETAKLREVAKVIAFFGRHPIDPTVDTLSREVEAGFERYGLHAEWIGQLEQDWENAKQIYLAVDERYERGVESYYEYYLARQAARSAQIRLLQAKRRADIEQGDELRRLLQTRYNEAKKMMPAIEAMYSQGTFPLEAVFEAWRWGLKAGLELDDRPAERVELLKKNLEWTKRIEGIVHQRLNGGPSTFLELHQARFDRLGAEIQLLRAQREADREKESAKQPAKVPEKALRFEPAVGCANGSETWQPPIRQRALRLQYR